MVWFWKLNWNVHGPLFGYCYLFLDQLVMQEEFQLALFQNRKKENLFANRVIILSLSGVYNFVANLKDLFY